jgi:hypothetical protein
MRKSTKDIIERIRKLGAIQEAERIKPELRRTCLGRLAAMSSFLVILLCLVSWIIVLLAIQESDARQTIPANILPQVRCIAFFGGVAFVTLIGGLLGNILRRILWRILARKGN